MSLPLSSAPDGLLISPSLVLFLALARPADALHLETYCFQLYSALFPQIRPLPLLCDHSCIYFSLNSMGP